MSAPTPALMPSMIVPASTVILSSPRRRRRSIDRDEATDRLQRIRAFTDRDGVVPFRRHHRRRRCSSAHMAPPPKTDPSTAIVSSPKSPSTSTATLHRRRRSYRHRLHRHIRANAGAAIDGKDVRSEIGEHRACNRCLTGDRHRVIAIASLGEIIGQQRRADIGLASTSIVSSPSPPRTFTPMEDAPVTVMLSLRRHHRPSP